jgi:hypothetical protein
MPLCTCKQCLNSTNGVGKELHRTNVKKHKENEERERELEEEYQFRFPEENLLYEGNKIVDRESENFNFMLMEESEERNLDNEESPMEIFEGRNLDDEEGINEDNDYNYYENDEFQSESENNEFQSESENDESEFDESDDIGEFQNILI